MLRFAHKAAHKAHSNDSLKPHQRERRDGESRCKPHQSK